MYYCTIASLSALCMLIFVPTLSVGLCANQVTLNGCLWHMESIPFSIFTPEFFFSPVSAEVVNNTCEAYFRYAACVQPYVSPACELSLLNIITNFYGTLCRRSTAANHAQFAPQCSRSESFQAQIKPCSEAFKDAANTLSPKSKWKCSRMELVEEFLSCSSNAVHLECQGVQEVVNILLRSLRQIRQTCLPPKEPHHANVNSKKGSNNINNEDFKFVKRNNVNRTNLSPFTGASNKFGNCSLTQKTDYDACYGDFTSSFAGNAAILGEIKSITSPLVPISESSKSVMCAAYSKLEQCQAPLRQVGCMLPDARQRSFVSLLAYYCTTRVNELFTTDRECLESGVSDPALLECGKTFKANGQAAQRKIVSHPQNIDGYCENLEAIRHYGACILTPMAVLCNAQAAYDISNEIQNYASNTAETEGCTTSKDIKLPESNTEAILVKSEQPDSVFEGNHVKPRVNFQEEPKTGNGAGVVDTSSVIDPTDVKPEPEASPAPEAEPEPETKPEPKAEPLPKPGSPSEPEVPEPEPETEPNPEPEAATSEKAITQAAPNLGQYRPTESPSPEPESEPEPKGTDLCFQCTPSFTCSLIQDPEKCADPAQSTFAQLETCYETCKSPEAKAKTGLDPVLLAVEASTKTSQPVDVVIDNFEMWVCDAEGQGCRPATESDKDPFNKDSPTLYPGKEACDASCATASAAEPSPSGQPCYFCNSVSRTCDKATGSICSPPPDATNISPYSTMESCAAECGGTPQCPENEEYERCGSPCPPSCEFPIQRQCEAACVSGCFCAVNYLRDLYSGQCIHERRCTPQPIQEVPPVDTAVSPSLVIPETTTITTGDAARNIATAISEAAATIQSPDWLASCAFCDDGSCREASDVECNPPLDQLQPWTSMESCRKYCGVTEQCEDDEFSCKNGNCIPERWVCDGENQCDEAEDELLPRCANVSRCAPNAVYSECARSCDYTCDNPGPAPCRRKCEPKCQCIPGYVRHNGYCIRATECPSDVAVAEPEPQPEIAPIANGTTQYFCTGTECNECKRNQCPFDIAIFDSPDTCSNNCPPTPDCFACDDSNCSPAFGMACFRQPSGKTFQKMDTCVEWCGKVENVECNEENEIFDDCGSQCSATCSNQGKEQCKSPCLPGCFCLEGFYRDTSTGKCVPLGECPVSDKVFYCDASDTIFCLLHLIDIPKILADMDIGSLQRLALPENKAKLDNVCGMFDKYKACADEEAAKKRCVVNGALDRLANTSSNLMCDEKMINLVIENSDCMDLLNSSSEYKACAEEFGDIIKLDRFDELFEGKIDKACEVIDGLKRFHPCASNVVQDVCEPSAKKLTHYFATRIAELENDAECAARKVARPEPEPKPETTAVVDLGSKALNMFSTTGCNEQEEAHVEQCFTAYNSLKNESLSVFDKGITKLLDEIEIVVTRSCNRYTESYKPCLKKITEDDATSCKVYSCLGHSVRTGCIEKPNLDEHWTCLFGMITNKNVIKCFTSSGIGFGGGGKTDWEKVIPELLTCIDEPVRTECGDDTMDFVQTLSTAIANTKDNGQCPIDNDFLDEYSFAVEDPYKEEETTTEEPTTPTTESEPEPVAPVSPEPDSEPEDHPKPESEPAAEAEPSTTPRPRPTTTPKIMTTTQRLLKTTPSKKPEPSEPDVNRISFAQAADNPNSGAESALSSWLFSSACSLLLTLLVSGLQRFR